MLFYSINMYYNSTKNNDTYCKINDKYETQKLKIRKTQVYLKNRKIN